MAAPWQTTIRLLEGSSNPAALDVLLHAVRGGEEPIRSAALVALLLKNTPRTNLEILRVSHTFPPPMRGTLERNLTSLSAVVRQAVLHGDESLRRNALQVIRWSRDVHQIPLLLSLLEQPPSLLRDQVVDLIGSLIESLHASLPADPALSAVEPSASTSRIAPSHPAMFDINRSRHTVVTALEASARRYEAHGVIEVIEWLLALGDPHDLAHKPLLSDSRGPIAVVVQSVLQTSRNPAIMKLLLRLMQENYPAAWAVRVFCRRSDPEFLATVLRSWPRRLSAVQQKNLKAITAVDWLDPFRFHIDQIPPHLHVVLVRVVVSLGLPLDTRLAVLEWVVRNGSPEGRLAATEILCELEDSRVQDVVLDSLTSEQPGVQAWATSQLRARDVPNCFELLVERLDSNFAEVREVARKELQDFDLQRVLEMFTEIDPARCQAVGRLMCKIDADAIQRLILEMDQPVRRKRIRAARCALALGLHVETLEGLLRMLQDSDMLVRRTAVEVLAYIPGQRAREALLATLEDPSPRIREDLRRALTLQEELSLKSAAQVASLP
jgi:HEAT repeat protein